MAGAEQTIWTLARMRWFVSDPLTPRWSCDRLRDGRKRLQKRRQECDASRPATDAPSVMLTPSAANRARLTAAPKQPPVLIDAQPSSRPRFFAPRVAD